MERPKASVAVGPGCSYFAGNTTAQLSVRELHPDLVVRNIW